MTPRWDRGRLLAPLILLMLSSGPGLTATRDGQTERHPQRPGSRPRPLAVPAGYVLTHNGWFHPSCVVGVGSDEVVGADLSIRGPDATERFKITPCGHPRYRSNGAAVAPHNPSTGALPEPPDTEAAAAIYDGYIVYYAYDGKIASGSTLTTEWIVPPAPTNVGGQDIAFFNDILTTGGGGDILQPVLDFNGEVQGKWAIESEHCCLAGNDMQTTPVTVSAGDLIRGVVTGTGCDSTGVCQSWAVTTTDVTTGKSTTLNTTSPMGVPNGVSPGSLETYGVSSCDMFPGGGETAFSGNTLTDPNGVAQALKYNLLTLNGTNAEVPRTCGYGGAASGSTYTLIYGKVTAGADAGTADAGMSARDASTTGAGGAGGAGVKDGGRSDADASRDAAISDGATVLTGRGGAGGGAPPGTGGVSGTGGSSSAGSSGGAPGGGGSPGTGGAPHNGAVADGPGCSCRTTPGAESPAGVLLVFALLLPARRRRRRRS